MLLHHVVSIAGRGLLEVGLDLNRVDIVSDVSIDNGPTVETKRVPVGKLLTQPTD